LSEILQQNEIELVDYLEETQSELNHDISSLFDQSNYSDIVIQSNEKKMTIHCHKAILSARSEFFQSMFSIGMKESNKDELIVLKEIKDDFTLKSIIQYLYGFDSKTVLNHENCLSLHLTSKLIGLKELETDCLIYASQMLDVENILDVIQIADFYSDELLKRECVSFIRENKKKIQMKEVEKIEDEKLLELIEKLII
jgi:hypothetical protein